MEKELYSRLEILLRSGEFQDLSETDRKLVEEELGGEKGFSELRKLFPTIGFVGVKNCTYTISC